MLSGLARFWHDALDRAAYLTMFARLRVLDWFAGPEPETEADLQRKAERKRLRRLLPEDDIDGTPPKRWRRPL